MRPWHSLGERHSNKVADKLEILFEDPGFCNPGFGCFCKTERKVMLESGFHPRRRLPLDSSNERTNSRQQDNFS
jgi:hypothetical protein